MLQLSLLSRTRTQQTCERSDTSALSRVVGMPVVSVNGRRRENLDALEGAVAKAMQTEPQTIRPNADLDQRFADLDAVERLPFPGRTSANR